MADHHAGPTERVDFRSAVSVQVGEVVPTKYLTSWKEFAEASNPVERGGRSRKSPAAFRCERAVRVENFASDRTGVLVMIQKADHRAQCVVPDDGIRVQNEKMPPSCLPYGLVVGFAEPGVEIIRDKPHIREARVHHFPGSVYRVIVDDHHFNIEMGTGTF